MGNLLETNVPYKGITTQNFREDINNYAFDAIDVAFKRDTLKHITYTFVDDNILQIQCIEDYVLVFYANRLVKCYRDVVNGEFYGNKEILFDGVAHLTFNHYWEFVILQTGWYATDGDRVIGYIKDIDDYDLEDNYFLRNLSVNSLKLYKSQVFFIAKINIAMFGRYVETNVSMSSHHDYVHATSIGTTDLLDFYLGIKTIGRELFIETFELNSLFYIKMLNTSTLYSLGVAEDTLYVTGNNGLYKLNFVNGANDGIDIPNFVAYEQIGSFKFDSRFSLLSGDGLCLAIGTNFIVALSVKGIEIVDIYECDFNVRYGTWSSNSETFYIGSLNDGYFYCLGLSRASCKVIGASLDNDQRFISNTDESSYEEIGTIVSNKLPFPYKGLKTVTAVHLDCEGYIVDAHREQSISDNGNVYFTTTDPQLVFKFNSPIKGTFVLEYEQRDKRVIRNNNQPR